MPFSESVWTLIAAPFAGSFLATLTVRLPAGEPVVFGRSACRSCAAVLGPRDLVPFASFLLLRRKCRRCGAAISWRYFAIELGAVALALQAALVMPDHLVIPTALLGWALLTLAVIDAEHFLIPDVLSAAVLLTGLLTSIFLIEGQILHALIGAALGGALMWAVAFLYRRLRGREGLGFGDVKFMAACGAWAGWQGLSTVLLWAVLLAFLTLLVLRLKGETIRSDTPVPFGAFLAAGIWITWLYGPFVLSP